MINRSPVAGEKKCKPAAPNVLVLGVGNMLLTDEGVGGRVVEEIIRHYKIPEKVEVIDGGTMGMDLLSYLDDRTHLLIVDAIKYNRKPGAAVRLPLIDPPAFFRTMISPHQLGLAEVLGISELTGCLPPNIVLFGIEPVSLETAIGLSSEVERNVPLMIEMIKEELASLGLILEPSADA
ncbi:MAG: HyaD/HybD family hydrogenase maturation endopeptidase [Desulfobulbaceae bacterium]|nr:HyaD/HybD family hydrogenase maturation endopeptidase [Desulfobulbaceae bacterium]